MLVSVYPLRSKAPGSTAIPGCSSPRMSGWALLSSAGMNLGKLGSVELPEDPYAPWPQGLGLLGLSPPEHPWFPERWNELGQDVLR